MSFQFLIKLVSVSTDFKTLGSIVHNFEPTIAIDLSVGLVLCLGTHQKVNVSRRPEAVFPL